MPDKHPFNEGHIPNSRQPLTYSSKWDSITRQIAAYRWLPPGHCHQTRSRKSDHLALLGTVLRWQLLQGALLGTRKVFYQICLRVFRCPVQLVPDEGPETLHSEERGWERRMNISLKSLTRKTFFPLDLKASASKTMSQVKVMLTRGHSWPFPKRDEPIFLSCREGWEGNTQLKGAWFQGSQFSSKWLIPGYYARDLREKGTS